MIDRSKYNMKDFLQNGQLIEEKSNQAYEQYYRIKFKKMQQKRAKEIYENYLNRIKSEYEIKNKRFQKDKSQYSNFGNSLMCLPLKSRRNVKKKIEQR